MSNGDAILEQELTPAPLAFIGEQLSPSPFHFRFTGEDFLELASYNTQPGVRIAVQGRTFDPETGIRPFAHVHVPNTDRTRDIEVFGLANGYLLNVVVFAASGAPAIGQTFVSLHVIRGLGQARVLLATLLQGYVTSEQELAFPGSPITNSIQGTGCLRTIVGTTPAVSAISTETVPTGVRWLLRTLRIDLTTSAVAANRRVLCRWRSGGAHLTVSVMPFDHPANHTTEYYFAPGVTVNTYFVTAMIAQGLPDPTALRSGDEIQISAVNFQTGDQFSAPRFVVEEWLEGQ